MNAEVDIRDLLPTIAVPSLVLHRADESWRDGFRFMGENIPGACVVELPGHDHLPSEGDREALLDEIERFLSVCARRRSRTACSPPFSSPTSSAPRRKRHSSVTARGTTPHQAPSPRASPARSLPWPRGRHGRCIAAAARPGEVVVSSTLKDIVAGSGIAFEEHGEHELEGVPGTWRLFTAQI